MPRSLKIPSRTDPPAPAFARVTDEDRAAAFDYEMRIPNEWEGVSLEVFGQPEKDGKPVADEGFNTYKLKLDSFNQPEWATHLDLKRDVLKKLTSVQIGVTCEKCTFENGTVVVDNIAFEK